MKEKLKSIITATTKFIKEQYQKSHNKWLQQQQIQHQQTLKLCIVEMMYHMTIDLYEAFHSHSYHLTPISTPQSIRLYNYKLVNGQYLYQFSVDKKTDEKIVAVLLQQMQNNMNRDIASAQRNIIYNYGYDYLCVAYPFLAYGIYVTSIQDLGLSEIIITVQTHITPQIFLKTYRQNTPLNMGY